MLKKILFALFVASFGLSLMSAAAYACVPGNPECEDIFKHNSMVTTAYHSKIEQPTDPVFGLYQGEHVPSYMLETDIPQLWLELPRVGFGRTSQVIAKWYSLDLLDSHGNPTLMLTQTKTGNSWNRNFWFSPTEWISRNDGSEGIRTVGTRWEVESSFKWMYWGRVEEIGCAKNTFVTPEPLGAALFLIGGIALSTRRFFKKKK